MTICTQCGTVMHEDDIETHICKIEDLPDKGVPIRKGYKAADVKL